MKRVEQLIRLTLLHGRQRVDWVARKMDLSGQITQVALQLGYDEPSHFARAFQRWIGRTPGEFRRSLGITRSSMAAD